MAAPMRINRNFHLLLALLTLAGTGCDREAAADFDDGFEARKARIVDHFVNQPVERGSYMVLAAKLLGDVDRDAALVRLDTLLSAPSGDMFWMFPSLAMYLFTRDILPDSMRAMYRDAWRTYTPYRGDTENHWVMYYASLYLASEEWPHQSGTTWYTGKSSSENLEEAREFLEHWVETTTTIGQGEFDSPHYMTVFLAPMFMLYEFAQDERMRTMAGMMVDYLLADFAVEYLRGNYCGGHSRDVPQEVTEPLTAAMTGFGYLYFGDAPFFPRHEALIAALTSYSLPEVIYHIATDRSVPYVHTETKRVRNAIRYSDELNPPAYKYTYMTSDFCLGSLHGGILQPIQQHTWDVTFAAEGPNNTLFSLHPHYSIYEVGKFFPEPVKILIEGITRSKSSYNQPDKWTGGSPYEQTFQHENAIIVLYDIEEGTPYPHIDAFFPKSLGQIDRDEGGWIFADAGNTYVAYYPLQAYEWIEEDVNWRLRSHALRNGVVAEAASASDFQSFSAFQDSIRSRPLDAGDFDARGTVRYTTARGDRMQFTYGGERLLNGTPVDFADYRLFNSKFMQADVGSRRLTMQAGGLRRTLDFIRMTTRDETYR